MKLKHRVDEAPYEREGLPMVSRRRLPLTTVFLRWLSGYLRKLLSV